MRFFRANLTIAAYRAAAFAYRHMDRSISVNNGAPSDLHTTVLLHAITWCIGLQQRANRRRQRLSPPAS